MYYIAEKKKTDLNITQITQNLLSQECTVPPTMLVNEAGVILHDTESSPIDTETAEGVLIDHLRANGEDLRYIAYCQLQRANGTATERAHSELGKFQLHQQNQKIVAVAREKRWL